MSSDSKLERYLMEFSDDQIHRAVDFLAEIPSAHAASLLISFYKASPRKCLVALANVWRTQQTQFIPVLWEEFDAADNEYAQWALLNCIAGLEMIRRHRGSASRMRKVALHRDHTPDVRLRAAQFLVERYRSSGRAPSDLRSIVRGIASAPGGTSSAEAVADLLEEIAEGPMPSP